MSAMVDMSAGRRVRSRRLGTMWRDGFIVLCRTAEPRVTLIHVPRGRRGGSTRRHRTALRASEWCRHPESLDVSSSVFRRSPHDRRVRTRPHGRASHASSDIVAGHCGSERSGFTKSTAFDLLSSWDGRHPGARGHARTHDVTRRARPRCRAPRRRRRQLHAPADRPPTTSDRRRRVPSGKRSRRARRPISISVATRTLRWRTLSEWPRTT